MPVRQRISDAEATARALWLVDNQLVDARAEHLDPIEALKVRLEALGMPDEKVFDRAAEKMLKSPSTVTENLHQLCAEMFIFRKGVPELHTDALHRRLARIIDPDALICLHPRFYPPADDRFDWAAVPVHNTGETATVLRDGSIDTHIHLGGCLPPVFYWVALMGGELPIEVLAAVPQERRGHADAKAWQHAIGKAMWLRLALARRMQDVPSRPRVRFPSLPPPGDRAWRTFEVASSETSGRRLRDATLRLTLPYRHGRKQPRRDQQRRQTWAFFDPLRMDHQDGSRPHYAAGERRLLVGIGSLLRMPVRTAQERAERSKLEDELLSYLRVRNAFHQALVHDHGTQGLLRFVETFGRRGFLFQARRARRRRSRRRQRLRRVALDLERCRMVAALDAQLTKAFDEPFPGGQHAPLRRVEMRVSVPEGRYLLPTLNAWLKGIRSHLKGTDAGGRVHHSQVGLVFHLLKHGNDARAERRAIDEARRLGNVLRGFSNLRSMIVGIDAAGDERRSPPRIFGKAFAQLRELEREHRPGPGVPAIKLGRTFHVGEDVDDLLTGLRHIHEVATLLLGREGGRLGHALALAENPTRFYQRRRGQTEPLLAAHLLDLVWARGMLSEANEAAYVPWLDQLIREMVPTDGGKVRECYRSMKPIYVGGPEEILSEEELLAILDFDFSENDPEQAITLQATPRWIELVRTLQHLLRRELAHRRLCIEANPTSNLIIGGYSGYTELPYQTLVDDELAVSINTDDPGLFITSLPGEFSAMYHALATTMSHRQAMQWLADRVFDANQSSFLGPQVPIGDDIHEVDWFFEYKPGW